MLYYFYVALSDLDINNIEMMKSKNNIYINVIFTFQEVIIYSPSDCSYFPKLIFQRN